MNFGNIAISEISKFVGAWLFLFFGFLMVAIAMNPNVLTQQSLTAIAVQLIPTSVLAAIGLTLLLMNIKKDEQ